MKKMDEMELFMIDPYITDVTKPFCLPCVPGRYGAAVKLGLIQGLTSPGRRFCWDLRYAFRDFHRLRSNIG